MDTSDHTLVGLLRQLGLDGDEKAIDAFLATHRLEEGTPLPSARFWTRAQAEFLRESLADDAEWAEAADELAARLARPD